MSKVLDDRVSPAEINYIFSFKDVSQAIKMQSEFDLAKAQLLSSHKLASLGTMAAGVAHELNNPLAVALGQLELFKHKSRTEEQKQKALDKVHSALQRMGQIITHVKLFSRESPNNSNSVFDLPALIADSFAFFDTKLRAQSIEYSLDFPNHPIHLHGDSVKIASVVQNLITNSIDAFEEHPHLLTREVHLQITTNSHGDVCINFEDTAGGIPKSIVDRVFDPFFTTKPTGKGTGLGLSIAYGIVQDHQGEIKVESVEGKGTKFIIILPSGISQKKSSLGATLSQPKTSNNQGY